MDEERRLIEEMRNSGQITPEEAAALMEALKAASDEPKEPGESEEPGEPGQPGEDEDNDSPFEDGSHWIGREISRETRRAERRVKRALREIRAQARNATREARREAERATREVREAIRRTDLDSLGDTIGDDIREGIEEGIRGLQEGLRGMRYGLETGLGEGLREAFRGVEEGLRAVFGPPEPSPWSAQPREDDEPASPSTGSSTRRAAGAAPGSAHVDPFELERPVGPRCRVYLVNPVGNLAIRAGSDGVVKVTGRKTVSGLTPEAAADLCAKIAVRADGGSEHLTFRVDQSRPEAWRPSVSVTVDLEVEVPGDAAVDIRSTRGDIAANGLSGGFEALVVDGDVRLDGLTGRIEAGSSHGDIVLKTGQVAGAELFTQDGDVSAEFTPVSGGRYDLKTVEGRVDIVVPAGSSIAIDAGTVNGEVKTEAELASTSRRTARELVGKIGDGDSQLRARVTDGDVTLRLV